MRRATRKVGAPLATATLLCLTVPLTTTPAAAQTPDIAEPPALNMGALPGDGVANSQPYTAPSQVGPVAQKISCVTSGAGPSPALDSTPVGQQRLRVAQAHEYATGRGQTIAVIDSGVSPHPRFGNRLIDGGDFVVGQSGLSDCDGHGTPVAGILGAGVDPNTGFVGMAPDAQILSIRQASRFYETTVLNPQTGREDTRIAGDTTSMARAIVRAVQRGATVINISEAACISPGALRSQGAPDLQAAVHFATESNVVVVVAAANVDEGSCRQNEGDTITTISSPGWFDDDVLTVAATSETGDPAEFTVRGPWVDVAAPGTAIVSLDAAGTGLASATVSPQGEVQAIQGTSFSTPYVAGLAALIRERYPQLTARQVMDRIQQTAQQTAGPNGRDWSLGHGMINPVAALTDILPGELQAPEQAGNPTLQDFRLPPPEDPLPRRVALAGSGAAVGLLGLTIAIVYTVTWHRRRTRGSSV